MRNPKSSYRFTWEATGHSPTIKVVIFNQQNTQFNNLTVTSTTESLLVSFTTANQTPLSLRVPVPRLLFDPDTRPTFKLLPDHLQVTLRLLLPVHHPLVTQFCANAGPTHPFVMDSDLKSLSAAGEVELFCTTCSTKLTLNPLRNFREMPSVNWRDVADNWFGTCCCSFGGVSEKLVSDYANSYSNETTVCLLTPTTITLCKDDLVGCNFSLQVLSPKPQPGPECDGEILSDADSCKVTAETEGTLQDECARRLSCCQLEGPEAKTAVEITPDKRSLLDGFLGNAFMARSSNLSADVEWKEYLCPQCSTLLGAYPLGDGCSPLDDRIHLFKCSISTCLPAQGPSDLFRNYDLGKMFSNQILEFGKYELTYRTVVTDLSTRSPVLQIVLLNMDSWLSTGYCSSADSTVKMDSELILRPVIKFLYSFCDCSSESQKRMTEAWIKKNQAEEVFMFGPQIEELTGLLESMNNVLPSTCTYLEGSTVSFMPR